MSQGDSWTERYLSVVPEKLMADDAQVILDLLREDPARFATALEEFVRLGDDTVVCECSPAVNPGCGSDTGFGSHAEGHLVPAEWRVAPQDSPDDFVHLCTPCKAHLAGQPGAMNLSFELLEHDVPGWEVAEGA